MDSSDSQGILGAAFRGGMSLSIGGCRYRGAPDVIRLAGGISMTTCLVLGCGMIGTSWFLMPTLQSFASMRDPNESASVTGRLTPQPASTTGSDFLDGSVIDEPHSNQTLGMAKLAARHFCHIHELTALFGDASSLCAAAAAAFVASRKFTMDDRYGYVVWTTVTALTFGALPMIGALGQPILRRMRRLAGVEDKADPYEAVMIDREQDRNEIIESMENWTSYNTKRGWIYFISGCVALADFVVLDGPVVNIMVGLRNVPRFILC